MDDRWAIYIDIEGFSILYTDGNDALIALKELMRAIYRIGKLVFPEPPDRLFVHQLGDGFLIVSDFHEPNLDRAVSIAIVLMKYITSFGLLARGTIAEGGFSDITGCYPKEVLDECRYGDNSVSPMGAGLMTIFPVMGTALINAVGIDKRSPKGPILTIPQDYKDRLSPNFISHPTKDPKIISVDWVHTEGTLLSEIREKAFLKYPCPENIETFLIDYIAKNELPREWKKSCSKYLGVNYA